MKTLRKILAINLFMVLTIIVGGQEPFFRNIQIGTKNDGLNINVLEQLPGSYLFIGTNKGLFRFDGYDAVLIPSTSNANDIRSIHTDSRGLTWLGYADGRIMQLLNDSIQAFNSAEGHPSVGIRAILETPDSLIWFGSYGEGIYYWDGKRQYNIDTDDGLPDNFIHDLVHDLNGHCWAGTDRGLVRCYMENNNKSVKTFGLGEGMNDLIVKSLAVDSLGRVWFGTYDGGIGFIDPETELITIPEACQEWNYGAVECILPYHDYIWAGTDQSGIIEYNAINGSSRKLNTEDDPDSYHRINDLLSDEQNNVWAASYGSLIWSGGRTYQYIELAGSPQLPSALLVDRSENIYTTRGNELWFRKKIVGTYETPVRIKLSNSVNSMISLHEDQAGRIWIGSFGDGIIVYDPLMQKDIQIRERLVNGNILSIDSRDNIVWLATLQGAVKITLADDRDIGDEYSIAHYGEHEGLTNTFIYKVFIDSRQRVWFGTDGNGLFLYDDGEIQAHELSPDASELVVYSIAEDNKGRIWFSTAKQGIYCVEDSTIHLGIDEEVANEDIRGIMADEIGNLIIAYDQSIDIYNTSNGHLLNISNEIASNLEGLNLNAFSIQANGAYLGGKQNILKINTGLLPGSFIPPTMINQVRLYDKKIEVRDGIRFSHDQNYLSFDYSGIWFMDPSLLSYQIYLEGNDIDWVNTASRNATYANLSPGDYTFQVRASTDDNFQNTRIASFSFSIARPFTATIWFYLIIIIFILMLVVAIVKIRERNLNRIKDLEKEKILFEFETLKSQVNPHFLFNSFSTLASIIEEDRDLAVDYVEKLSEFFRKILENRDRELIPLEEELRMIESYIEIQKKRFGKSLTLIIDLPEATINSLIPPLVLQLLIENAIKHNIISTSKPLTITISQEADSILIRNNKQPRVNLPSSTGLGLENIKRRYALLNRKNIHVYGDEKDFIVKLPIITS